MPPKKESSGPSKKTVTKAKEKTIEDKTFGLKNKKGTKNQKFIAQVEKQVKTEGDPQKRRLEQQKLDEKKRKEEAKRLEEENKKLFKPVHTQKVAAGADPKSVFCAFFKQGLCKKGDKCKFSHDPTVEGKAAKRNIYTDERDEEKENMDDWTEEELAEVVNQRHGSEKRENLTNIICKFFLDAVESNKYGWFWNCPNGNDKCMYKHALPPGFVLKKDKKEAESTKEEISIEELIEKKRTELCARSGDLTKVTLETFVAWKRRKIKEKNDEIEKEQTSRKEKYKAGLGVGMSGREMFSFDPKIAQNFEDDDDEGGEFDFECSDEEDDGVRVHEIKFDAYGIMDDGLDESTDQQLAKLKAEPPASTPATAASSATNGNAAATASDAVEAAAAELADVAAAISADAIDENLFDDEDLDELEEDLENLEV